VRWSASWASARIRKRRRPPASSRNGRWGDGPGGGGPFADFNGVIEDINLDQSKVRVLVDIFGRETPVELSFEQIQKF